MASFLEDTPENFAYGVHLSHHVFMPSYALPALGVSYHILIATSGAFRHGQMLVNRYGHNASVVGSLWCAESIPVSALFQIDYADGVIIIDEYVVRPDGTVEAHAAVGNVMYGLG
jgi:hypothetical protein